MVPRAFETIPVPGWPAKPREQGITMVLDWGLPNSFLADLLRMAADSIDIAKIAIGTGRLYPEPYLREKIAIYQGYKVDPCPGGNLFEHAAAQGLADDFLKAAWALGFRHVEASNNRGLLPRREVGPLITKARHEYGFRVFGEVGSEVERTSVSEMISDIRECLAAGSEKVYVEATDLVESGVFDVARAKALAAAVSPDHLIFELAGWWVKGMDMFEVHRAMVELVKHFGPLVNIGNVAPEDVFLLECVRRDLE